MNIKKTRYGCHIINGHDTDVCVTNKNIQIMYLGNMVTVYCDNVAKVTVHNVQLKDIESDFTIEV